MSKRFRELVKAAPFSKTSRLELLYTSLHFIPIGLTPWKIDIHAASANVSPEAGLGADDEAAAVLVEVGELELGTRCVVVRGHVHGEAILSLDICHFTPFCICFALLDFTAFLAHLTARLLD